MATFNGQVAANADDGYTYPGTFTVGSYAVGYDGDYNHAFARFLNVTIPKGATITSAKIQYKAMASTTPINTQSSIYANKVVAPTSPTSESTFAAKALTTAFVNWDSVSAWAASNWYDSPDISTVIQEIVNQSSWASGNAIMIMHKNRRASGSTGYLEMNGYENGAANSPKLVITYSTSVSASFAISNSNSVSVSSKKKGLTAVELVHSNSMSVEGINPAVSFKITNSNSVLASGKKGGKYAPTNYARGKYTNQDGWNNEVYSTDGNTDMNYYTATTTGLQHFDVDLTEIKLINLIKLWHYYESGRVYHDIIVQISPDDPNFTTNFTTVFNNDTDNSAGFGVGYDAEYSEQAAGKSINFPAQSARYLRFYSNGNSKNAWNHIVEIQAFYDAMVSASSVAATGKKKALSTVDISGNSAVSIALERSGGELSTYLKVYDAAETVFTGNGLCVLNDCISASSTEELNGAYEVEIEHPLDDRGKWLNLIEDNIIKADGQLFRIYHKTKTLSSIKINARHIFYDLIDNFLEDVRPTALNGAGALNWMLSHTQYAHSFTSVSDVPASSTWDFVRKNPVEAIMGTDGIIARIGGELERDNFVINLHQARGADRGVLVAYGKNIQGIEETLDTSGIVTRLLPIGKDGLMLSPKYVDSPYINNYPHPKVAVIEFSNIDNVTDLAIATNDYILNSKCDIPQFNYKIDFVELTKTEEYKKYMILETAYMADTVTIKHSKLNIDIKAKVIKIVKNLITGRIEKIELGSFKPNISNINKEIQAIKIELVQTQSDFAIAVDNATKQITGAERGHIVIRQDENSYPYELLIMDTNDMVTAKSVWRWNLGGLGYSKDGINGPYELAINQDGSIVATFITTGRLNASLLKTGSIISTDGSLSIGIADGAFTLGGTAGTVAKHTNAYSKWSHSSGDYSQADSTGFFKHVAAGNQDYHYLFASGSLSVGVSASTITLPTEFKNKNFKVTVSITSSENPSPYNGETMVNLQTTVTNIDKTNGKFSVNGYGTWYDCRELIADQIKQPPIAGNYRYTSGVTITWIATA